MRGSPLLRALAALVVLLTLGYPLHRLLQGTATEPNPEAVSVPQKESSVVPGGVHLQLTFTSKPSRFRILSLGNPVWESTAPDSSMERDLPILFPAEGVELTFEAEWSSTATAAARLQLTSPDGVEYDRTVWSTGETSAIVAFP